MSSYRCPCLSFGLAVAWCVAGPVAQTAIAQRAAAFSDSNLPESMLRVGVEGAPGKVRMGIKASAALKLVRGLYPRHKQRRVQALRNIRSELGGREVEVASFLLSKYPVTNAEYARFLKGTGVAEGAARFPFHWWVDSFKSDLDAKRAMINRLYPGDHHPALLYWLDHWRELPSKVPPGQEDWPVSFVSYADALRCAAFYGMRLPTEAEWTMAARGTEGREFVWGDTLPKDLLKQLRMENLKDRQAPGPVGRMGPLARGPFGHEDMFGQVWELVSPVGYHPQNGRKAYVAESAVIARDPLGKRRTESLVFGDEYVVVKGGSFYSLLYENWIELRVNTRAHIRDQDVLRGVGFRMAKTARPGFDLAKARLKLDRPHYLIGEQEPDLDGCVGVEHYTLSADRSSIEAYHAISYVPLTHLTLAGGATKAKFLDKTLARPQMLGLVVTTQPLRDPALDPGVYVVHYRGAGVPKSLEDAVMTGRKAVRKNGADAKGAWRTVIARYGYKPDDLLAGTPTKVMTNVYLANGKERMPVPTAHDCLIYRDKTGKWLATQKVPRFRVTTRVRGDTNSAVWVGDRLDISTYLPIHKRAAKAKNGNGKRWLFKVPLTPVEVRR